MGEVWAVDAIALNFLTEIDFTNMGFKEIRLLK